jgi:hypothetical protein
MGVGATDTAGRVLASLHGAGPVASQFEPCADVPRAGVLLAVPALLACGLLAHTEKRFVLPPGYYSVGQVFLRVAFLALARIKSLEGLRYCAPGEWGKVLGLDRVPEVRTLRGKLAQLGQPDQVAAWAGALCQDWMRSDPEAAGTLYVDGHVRVYHGSAAQLPQHYVSRQRLCLRATTDYWVNAADGQPCCACWKKRSSRGWKGKCLASPRTKPWPPIRTGTNSPWSTTAKATAPTASRGCAPAASPS